MILAGVCLLFTSCIKNRFSVEGTLEGSAVMNLTFVYLCSDSEKGWVAEQSMPVMEGHFAFQGATKSPTVVFVMNSTMELLTVFYVERGDKITISGKASEPESWRIGGNKINEKWSEWRASNAKELHGAPPEAVNALVAKYVKENPGDKLSTLLMLTTYDRNASGADFGKLWNSIKESARSEAIIRAVGRVDIDEGDDAGRVKLPALKVYSSGDTIVTVDPRKSAATLLFFWSRPNMRHDSADPAREFGGDSVQIVDLMMKPDSTGWRRVIATDTVGTRIYGWLYGAFSSPLARDLAVDDASYYIVVDRAGKQLYRGNSPQQAGVALKKIFQKNRK